MRPVQRDTFRLSSASTSAAASSRQGRRSVSRAVVMEADHFCMHWRGVKDSETMMINSVMRGSFLKDHTLRSEFLSLIKNRT